MSDFGKDSDTFRKEKPGLTRSLEENFHLHKSTAEKVVRFAEEYTAQSGKDLSKVRTEHFSRIYSFNNVVFEFDQENGLKLAVKLFSSDEGGQSGFEAESLGKKFLQSSRAFSPESGILLPKIVFENKEDRLIATEFIDDLDQIYPLNLDNKRSKLIVDFLIRLNELKAIPTNLEQFTNRSRYSKDSVFEIYQETIKRFEEFKNWLQVDGNTTTRIWCKDNNILNLFESKLELLPRIIDPTVFHRQVEPNDLRFNWGDVSFPNMNFKKMDGKQVLVPVDMEYAGWDHFSGGITSLLMHHSSEDLSESNKTLILNQFVKNSRFSALETEELSARLIATDLLFISRKLKPVIRPAHETNGLRSMRITGESYIQAKIRMFLEPALDRLSKDDLKVG